jgi:DNA polymerase
VPGVGPADAAVVFVGEAPGAEEDRTGRPFAGRSGGTFDRLLDDAGLERGAVFVTSAVKCRPPGNRNPRTEELDTCRAAWLERQLDRLRPALVVTLGAVPLRQLTGETRRMRELHGRVRAYRGTRLLPTYHPAAAMRFPDLFARAREDVRRIPPLLGE